MLHPTRTSTGVQVFGLSQRLQSLSGSGMARATTEFNSVDCTFSRLSPCLSFPLFCTSPCSAWRLLLLSTLPVHRQARRLRLQRPRLAPEQSKSFCPKKLGHNRISAMLNRSGGRHQQPVWPSSRSRKSLPDPRVKNNNEALRRRSPYAALLTVAETLRSPLSPMSPDSSFVGRCFLVAWAMMPG